MQINKHYRGEGCVLTVYVELDFGRGRYRIGYSLCRLDAERYERRAQNARAARRLREGGLVCDPYLGWLDREFDHPHLADLYLGGLSTQLILDELKMEDEHFDDPSSAYMKVIWISGQFVDKHDRWEKRNRARHPDGEPASDR